MIVASQLLEVYRIKRGISLVVIRQDLQPLLFLVRLEDPLLMI
jgi:hypothetical protein